MRKLAAVTAAAVVALGVLAAGGAAAPPLSESQKGVSADAFWESCTTERGLTTCTFVSLFAFQGTQRSSETGTFKGTRVCLFVDTFSFRAGPGRGRGGDSSFESGCTTAPAGTLAVASDLGSASLAATTVTLDTYECTEEYDCTIVGSRDASVAADWVATGPLFSNSGRFRFSDGTCTETFSFKSQSREAIAAGTLDGSSLGDGFGFLNDGTFTFRTTCV